VVVANQAWIVASWMTVMPVQWAGVVFEGSGLTGIGSSDFVVAKAQRNMVTHFSSEQFCGSIRHSADVLGRSTHALWT
jgi:hypothetical protein